MTHARTAEDPILRVDELSVLYAGRAAVSEISFSLRQGEFLLLTGPSGSGKSTLALAIAGLIPMVIPAEMQGHVIVDGLETRSAPQPLIAQRVGIVLQNPSTQLFNNTVEEEIAFAPRNCGLPAGEVEERVEYALQAAGIVHLRHRTVRHLSGGERQRVAIASLVAMRPVVLVLDEPTAHLDSEGVAQIVETLGRLNRQEGMAVIVMEHRLHPFISLADRAMVLQAGRVLADGAPAEVFGDESFLRRLGIRNPWFPIGPRCALLPPQDIRPPARAEPPLVCLQGVSAGYERHAVVHDIDLALYAGEFVGLVGPNGAGKSTLARLLAGELRPLKGKIRWSTAMPKGCEGRRVGMLFQDPELQLFRETVWEEVAFAPTRYGLAVEEAVSGVLDAAGLASLRARHPLALSLGQKQRVALAAALSAEPALLILDEPTMGQDWGHLERLMEFLQQLHAAGRTILLITHDEKLIFHYAERILILRDGRLVADGPPRPAGTQEALLHPLPYQEEVPL